MRLGNLGFHVHLLGICSSETVCFRVCFLSRGALGVSSVSSVSFGGHFGELGGCLWELLGPMISLGKLLGFLWELLGFSGGLWALFGDLLGLFGYPLWVSWASWGIPGLPQRGRSPRGAGPTGQHL